MFQKKSASNTSLAIDAEFAIAGKCRIQCTSTSRDSCKVFCGNAPWTVLSSNETDVLINMKMDAAFSLAEVGVPHFHILCTLAADLDLDFYFINLFFL